MIFLVGEMNPYGEDPRYALYDEPTTASGFRLRAIIFGLERRTYLDDKIFSRRNLCVHGHWSRPEARASMERIVDGVSPGDLIIALGRRVAETHHKRLRPFEHGDLLARRARMLALPHPSGLCREWNDPAAIHRAREILRSLAASVPWGELRP